MPTTDSTDDLRVSGDVDFPAVPPSTQTTVPLPAKRDPDIETRAASMSNTDRDKALSSPAEASPAKLPSTSPSPPEDTSPSTSRIASAADSLPCRNPSIINVERDTASSSTSAAFGSAGDTEYPAKLTFRGVTVTLESSKVWNDFHQTGTEMIVTRPGRHMFPYCRYRISGLDPERRYSMVLSIPPADSHKYRWCGSKWEVTGPAEHLSQGLIRAFAHQSSPLTGAEWMFMLISFKKLKLTNNSHDQEGNIILHSLHRYIPRLHVIPVPDDVSPTADQPVVMGPESMTFTFPQTEFMTVTTYQNFRITQMKIRYNPFAKSFREDGCNPRLKRVVNREVELVEFVDNVGATAVAERETDLSSTAQSQQRSPMILKPIMSPFSESAFVQCRGKHALGNLVLSPTPHEEPRKASDCPINLTPPMKLCITMSSKPKLQRPATAPQLLKYKKKRKHMNWGQRKPCTGRAPSPPPPPPPRASIQPELDDVEGLLFVSFTSKSALNSHIGDQPVVQTSSSQSSVKETPLQLHLHLNPETGCLESEDDKLLRSEIQLLQDLQVHKHRQTIHPALQIVGLKLNSLDPSQPLDLHYLGVELPLSPDANTDGTDDKGSFISRTGKTSDFTKIKGWRSKFVKKEDLPHSEENVLGSKNLSAFCSNMLDEYLKTEEQQISERAEAFSTHPQGPVSYELPAKSSSYVKTLDSVLRDRRTPPSKLMFSEPPSSASPSPSPSPALSEDIVEVQASPGPVAHRLSKFLPALNPRPVSVQGKSDPPLPNLTKPQLKLHEMEVGAWNSGLKRTALTLDRTQAALCAVMTRESQVKEMFKVPQYQSVAAPPCGQVYCRLGCVCDSVHSDVPLQDRRTFHCRRPDCMFQCSCFKHNISRNLLTTNSIYSSYFIKNPEKLWVKSVSDCEPLLVPETKTPDAEVVPKATKQHRAAQVREEDKDPVYRYLESRLTCARVREFNCKHHHVETLEDLRATTVPKPATPTTTTTTPNTAAPPPPPSAVPKTAPTSTEKTVEKPVQNVFVLKKKSDVDPAPAGKRARTLIELQSTCKWAKDDRRQVLEALCLNMNRNRLCRSFCVGSYRVKPIAKVIAQKANERVVTYKVRISLKSNSADSDGSDGENKTREEKPTERKEKGEVEVLEAVTPFLSGIQAAGVLKAHTAGSGKDQPGLVQVNGKFYSHARLMLGRMGSLHPANRVAAFVTGRLAGTSNLYERPANPAPKVAPDQSAAAAAETGPAPALGPSSEGNIGLPALKMPAQLRALMNLGKPSPTQDLPPPAPPPDPDPKPSQSNRDSPFQSSTPVALTVSPSLKTPRFLLDKGTYSFRLCPPEHHNRNLPGVALPGGFTLIQLSKSDPEPDTAKKSQNRGSNAERLAQIFGYELKSNKKKKKYNSSKIINARPIEISDDSQSEESDFSDEDEEDDEEEEEIDVDDELSVDVESVFCTEEKQIMKRLRVAAGLDPRSVSIRKRTNETDTENLAADIRERNYTRMCSERQRRIEHKELFENLQTVLETKPGLQTPKVHLLTMATKEIKSLTERSKYLQEKKRLLTQIQDGYVKEIALMSGKPEELILEKLRNVCKKQKPKEEMNFDTSYSDLLQCKAAMVQAISPSTKPNPAPSLLPPVIKAEPESPPNEICVDESEESEESDEPEEPDDPDPKPNAKEQIEATAKNFMQQLLTKLKPIIHNAKSCHQIARARRELAERDKANGGTGPSGPTITASPASRLSSNNNSSTNNNNSNNAAAAKSTTKPTAKTTPQTLALPLVRTKDGRIILPSSVKPAAQQYYTLRLVNSPKGQEGEQRPTILLQPLDPEAVKNNNLNVPANGNSETVQSLQPSQSDKAQSLVFKSPLANIGYVNQPTSNQANVNSVSTTSSTSPMVLNVNQVPQTVIQTFRHPIFTPASYGICGTPPAKRGRGRPRKHPLPGTEPTPVLNPTIVIKDDPDFAPSYSISQNPIKRPAEVSSQFVPIKRGRGRPPKNSVTHLEIRANPYSRRIKVEDEEWDVTVNSSGRKESGARHLTRGSMGKDFPSAKRRSWIDIENDSDVDID